MKSQITQIFVQKNTVANILRVGLFAYGSSQFIPGLVQHRFESIYWQIWARFSVVAINLSVFTRQSYL